jgi:hypothetical protein
MRFYKNFYLRRKNFSGKVINVAEKRRKNLMDNTQSGMKARIMFNGLGVLFFH